MTTTTPTGAEEAANQQAAPPKARKHSVKPNEIRVEGAGTKAVNGVYTLRETNVGGNIYVNKNQTFGVFFIRAEGSRQSFISTVTPEGNPGAISYFVISTVTPEGNPGDAFYWTPILRSGKVGTWITSPIGEDPPPQLVVCCVKNSDGGDTKGKITKDTIADLKVADVASTLCTLLDQKATLSAETKTKDDTIVKLKQESKAKDTTIATLEQESKAKDVIITKLEQESKAKDKASKNPNVLDPNGGSVAAKHEDSIAGLKEGAKKPDGGEDSTAELKMLAKNPDGGKNSSAGLKKAAKKPDDGKDSSTAGLKEAAKKPDGGKNSSTGLKEAAKEPYSVTVAEMKTSLEEILAVSEPLYRAEMKTSLEEILAVSEPLYRAELLAKEKDLSAAELEQAVEQMKAGIRKTFFG